MLAQLEHGAATVISSNGVMHRLPQPFDDIDPRVVGGLEAQLELRVCIQPPLNHLTLVNTIVVEDEDDFARPPILAAKLLKQL